MKYFVWITLFFFFCACSENKASQQIDSTPSSQVDTVDAKVNPVYQYLFDTTLADGFFYPIKWKNQTSDRNQRFVKKIVASEKQNPSKKSEFFIYNSKIRDQVEIVMPAHGWIVNIHTEMDGLKTIETFHTFIENGEKKAIGFSIHGLDSTIQFEGGFLKANTTIGLIKSNVSSDSSKIVVSILITEKAVPFFLESPTQFVKDYAKCMVPQDLDKLIFAHKSDYKMYYFEKGVLKKEYVIALSQNPIGHKQKQGDNKLPEGTYRISEKKLGPFGGEVGPWLGDAWMQFSYPNQYDAINGYKNGTITHSEKNAIVKADKNALPTNSYTELGGRVGIHGWNGDWIPNGTQNLTWGCISMFNRDIMELYDKVTIQTPIIIVP